MSTAIMCDRCGCLTHGGLWIDVGDAIDGYDLCRDCAREIVGWIESGKPIHTEELAFSDGCRDPEVTGGWPDECANDALPPENDVRGEQADASDTRAKLEADVREFAQVYYTNHLLVYDKVISLLDRQAAITEREVEHDLMKAGRMAVEIERKRIAELEAERDEMAQRIQTLELEARKGEEYRAKLGAVLDALHEAERAAK